MRLVLTAAGAVALAAPALAAPAPIAGRWLSDDKAAIVEIAPCGAQLCGRIATILKPQPGTQVDARNPDPALRSRPMLGLLILSGFVPGGDRWKGRIYDPRSGRSYRSEVLRDGGTLHVKGCIGPFCRTLDWTRAG